MKKALKWSGAGLILGGTILAVVLPVTLCHKQEKETWSWNSREELLNLPLKPYDKTFTSVVPYQYAGIAWVEENIKGKDMYNIIFMTIRVAAMKALGNIAQKGKLEVWEKNGGYGFKLSAVNSGQNYSIEMGTNGGKLLEWGFCSFNSTLDNVLSQVFLYNRNEDEDLIYVKTSDNGNETKETLQALSAPLDLDPTKEVPETRSDYYWPNVVGAEA